MCIRENLYEYPDSHKIVYSCKFFISDEDLASYFEMRLFVMSTIIHSPFDKLNVPACTVIVSKRRKKRPRESTRQRAPF